MHSTAAALAARLILAGAALASLAAAVATVEPAPEPPPPAVARFAIPAPTLQLTRSTQPGAFVDVVGRRAAWFGYEHRPLEAWVYPLKVLDELTLSFTLEGYPLEIPASEIARSIDVRPEATIITYSHAAFTVREILVAPIDEPSLVLLLDIQSTLPLQVHGAFRPRLRLMWPGGLMTSNVGWDADAQGYALTEESRRFAGFVLVPGAKDVSLMPYQEEPRDVPVRFIIDATTRAARELVPIVVAGSVTGIADARARARATLDKLPALVEQTAAHYRQLLDASTRVQTPDAALDRAYAWALVGMDKGLATNPLLGTGLLAGFRTSGDSERPGFAWFFGRDALWTSFGLIASGNDATTRTALDFLAKYQREDGKIPHEVSQSAALLPWFTDYTYPWASADATPLYVIAHADYWRTSGDIDWIRRHWPSIRNAFAFSRATDTDGNGLIENTKFGHGWVEGGALYPAHEEVYMQGVWVAAQRAFADMADAMGEAGDATAARAGAERTRAATEQRYWLEDRGFYAFATQQPLATPKKAEPGPARERRQQRLNQLASATLVDEDTVLPAVPLWWKVLDPARADRQINRLGSGALASDWGARLLSSESALYDPLSYHYGSVWPLFTGWNAMAAYAYGRPHVGFQALQSTAHLTWDGALGYVTELLSGEFNAAFGRSSHHQVWSEAMVVTPLLRGLLGIEVDQAGRHLTFAPQLPADWDRVRVGRVHAGAGRYDLAFERRSGAGGSSTATLRVAAAADAATTATEHVTLAPAFPLDADVVSVTVDGRRVRPAVTRTGDIQRAAVDVDLRGREATAVFEVRGGTDVYVEVPAASPGATSEGLRILRSRADASSLRLLVEGVGGRTYQLHVRSSRQLGPAEAVTIEPRTGGDVAIGVRFQGSSTAYVRREILLPLR